MGTVERKRRRDIKDAYRRDHGGAMSPISRRARLRGPMPSLGLALAIAGAIESCRTMNLDQETIVIGVLSGDVARWNLRGIKRRIAPAFEQPRPAAPGRSAPPPVTPDGR